MTDATLTCRRGGKGGRQIGGLPAMRADTPLVSLQPADSAASSHVTHRPAVSVEARCAASSASTWPVTAQPHATYMDTRIQPQLSYTATPTRTGTLLWDRHQHSRASQPARLPAHAAHSLPPTGGGVRTHCSTAVRPSARSGDGRDQCSHSRRSENASRHRCKSRRRHHTTAPPPHHRTHRTHAQADSARLVQQLHACSASSTSARPWSVALPT